MTQRPAIGVLVKFHPYRRGPRGKRGIGEITEIIERETHQFVGTYYEEAGLGLVRVDGRSLVIGGSG